MPDDDFDDEYDDNEPDQHDDTPVIRKLRKELRDAKKDSKRAAELEKELFAYKSRDAFTNAGLELNDRQRKALLSQLDDPNDLSPTSLKTLAIEFGWAQPDEQANQADEVAQQAIVAAAQGAKNSGPINHVSPDDFKSWDMPRRKDFYDRYPEKFAALERGETVRMT